MSENQPTRADWTDAPPVPVGDPRAAFRQHLAETGHKGFVREDDTARCGTCGFYLRLAGSLQAAFGVCGNELASTWICHSHAAS